MSKKPRKTQKLSLAQLERIIQEALDEGKKNLDLSKQGLETLPESIGQLTQLTTLLLSQNELTSLPESFGQLTQLRRLYISQNQLTSLPESIVHLTQLQGLIIWGNQLKELPRWIGKLTHLEYLDVSHNQLKILPTSISQLTQLESLDVSRNQLKALPKWIGKLTQLQNLDVGRNQFKVLQSWIGQLTQLRSLDVSGNQITNLPDSAVHLTQLLNLNVSRNQLKMLPEWIGQLTQLQNLGISGNKIPNLPESIGQLGQLQSLNVSSNQLMVLPDWVGKLSMLTSLFAIGIKLTTLPEWIGQLTQLQKLDVSNNQLMVLPDSIGQLTQLQVLDVSENQLTTLPESIRELASLRRLFLHGNDALDLPPEVLGPSWQDLIGPSDNPANPAEIIAYYFRTREGRRPLNEAKLILVGYGAVGKTSLVNRLVHDRFDKDEKETPGIRITQWPIRLPQEEAVRLHIWDFGGQEIMHSTHHFFLTQRSLYVLVLNGRQGHEDHDAEYWLSLIQSFGEDSPVIVVLNKITEHPFNVNQGGLREKFPAIRAFVQTDCEDGKGIDELRLAIERETDRLEHLRDAFPATWFSIKNRLAGMDENYLTFDRYREICREHGETDMQAQGFLAIYLHSLGIALNYKDDPRLSDTHVLNPHWVTNGIYRILKAPQLASQKGELRLTDVADILDPTDYPAERRNFLLELMRKFELCVSFPDYEGHYLIPELLDK